VRCVVAVALVAACGRIGFDARDGGDDGSGATSDACVLGPFSAPQELVELDSAMNETGVWIADDRLEIAFISDRSGVPQLYHATRALPSGPFGAPTVIDVGTSMVDDPVMTQDRLTLYVASGSPQQLYRATRTTTAAAFPALAEVTELSGGSFSAGPSLTLDQRTIVFSSVRAPATSEDLFIAHRANPTDPFDPPARIAELATSKIECCPSVLRDGDELAFASDASGAKHIMAASAVGGVFGAPASLGLAAATGDEGGPTLTSDGRTIVFASSRAGGTGGYDLYVADRACL
jgi:hypothetical protein